MPNTHPPLIHVGYHKTATTWMQRLLFMPVHGYRQIAGHDAVFTHLVQPHGLRFDPAPMQALIAAQRRDMAPDEVPVISSEILSGHPFQGGHESDIYAARIKAVAPDARILISIRSQLRILPSVYMQYVLRGGTMPYDQFFKGTTELGYFGFTPEHFEFDLLVAHYQKLFGAQNVHVLTQESLQADMQAACGRLAGFAGNTRFAGLEPRAQKVHAASYPEYAAPVLRRINHVQRSTLNPVPVIALGTTPKGLYKLAGFVLRQPVVARVLGGRKPVTAHVRQRFAGHFTASNARLAALCDAALDLSRYD